MLNVMSKFINIGMSVEDVIERATWQIAKAIHREDLGHLSVGAIADLTLLQLQVGNFGFIDAGKNKIEGKNKLETELTMKDGKVVYDLNGLAANKYQ
jgi:dihydroorotase